MGLSKVVESSFRDPAGFLFWHDNELYRQINDIGREDYDYLMSSGLYLSLVANRFLIPHTEVEIESLHSQNAYKIIRPQLLPVISYPYEWCFEQLKDAALLTLKIQKMALEYEMSLKDASVYNIQFYEDEPILIDTLSFEHYTQNEPWRAYRQFCQHFLAPLALMSFVDVRLSQLLRSNIDGIPLDLASKLLPVKTRLQMGMLLHIHWHAKAQTRYTQRSGKKELNVTRQSQQGDNKMAILGLIDNLEVLIHRLQWRGDDTPWLDYYSETNYSDNAFQQKLKVVNDYIDRVNPHLVWDLGANEGIFSRITSKRGVTTVAYDVDMGCVQRNYLQCKTENEKQLYPLVIDLTNPSPALGWSNKERSSFLERGPVDLVMALALIHHLAIGNNVPLSRIADFFSQLGKWLIIEFVPKEDSQVQRLLSSRQDIFQEYARDYFEKIFDQHFEILDSQTLTDSKRVLYLMRSR